MKRILMTFAIAMTSLVIAKNHDQHTIDRLVLPYEQALEFVAHLDSTSQVNDHDVFVFFNNNDLHEDKDIRKFNHVVRRVKKLTYSKKSLRDNREQLEILIDNLDKIQRFIIDHAATRYALTTYYEISSRYYYIDEHHRAVADLIVTQSDKLGLPDMQGRGLYKFAKRIDLDMRRLTALFVHVDLSDDLVVKVNALKIKLVSLKNKITSSSMYKSQLSKTRWLKAFGVLTVYGVMLIPIILIEELSLGGAMVIGLAGGIVAGNIVK